MDEVDSLDPNDFDPDVAYGIIINQGVEPLIVYDDDEVKVCMLLEDVYQIVHDGTDEMMELGTYIIQEEYDDVIHITVWESTQLNEHRYTTTVLVSPIP